MASSSLRLVFDEHFSHHQVEFVQRESRLAALYHTRDFQWSGVDDVDWMPVAIQRGFLIVSADRNDQTRGFTVPDMKAMRARVILVGGFWDRFNRWEKAKWLVATADRIFYVAGAMTPGSVTLLVDKYAKKRDL